MKLAVCLPGNSFTDKTMQSLMQLNVFLMTHHIPHFFAYSYSPYVIQVRNAIVGFDAPLFHGKEYTHMFWVDSDIEFGIHDFFKLVAHDLPIISGAYMMGRGEWSICTEMGEGGLMMPDDEMEEYYQKGKLIEAGWTGFGFILIKNGVFEKLKRPWFDPLKDSVGRCLGEDVSWCMRAREEGYKLMVDPTIDLTHHKRQGLRRGMSEHQKKLMELKANQKLKEMGAKDAGETTSFTGRDN